MIPDITIVIVTYNRPKEIRQTIHALQEHIVYAGKLHWLLADDGSPGTYVQDLLQEYPYFAVSSTNRGGWGRNVNAALHKIDTDLFFLCEDDYVARLPLDFDTGATLLSEREEIGLVRYDGVIGHVELQFATRCHHREEADIHYATILPSSVHLNTYSNRPHMCHRRFHESYGMYRENVKLGETEEAFAHTVKDRYTDGPEVIILQTGLENAFDHIGKSWQSTGSDITH